MYLRERLLLRTFPGSEGISRKIWRYNTPRGGCSTTQAKNPGLKPISVAKISTNLLSGRNVVVYNNGNSRYSRCFVVRTVSFLSNSTNGAFIGAFYEFWPNLPSGNGISMVGFLDCDQSPKQLSPRLPRGACVSPEFLQVCGLERQSNSSSLRSLGGF